MGWIWPRWFPPSSLRLGSDRVATGQGYGQQTACAFKVVAYDFGVKNNILRMLASRGCAPWCPWTCRPRRYLPSNGCRGAGPDPDGIFPSNGPGIRRPRGYAITAVQQILDSGVFLLTFGICLGHQIMALAAWAPALSRWPTATTAATIREKQHKRIRARQHHQPEPRFRRGISWIRCLPICGAAHVSLFDGTPAGPGIQGEACVQLPGSPRGLFARVKATSPTCLTASPR